MCLVLTAAILLFVVSSSANPYTMQPVQPVDLGSEYTIADGLLGSALSVIMDVKAQFREIIIDIALQAFRLIKEWFARYNVYLQKKLAKYNLSQVFEALVNCVNEFIIDPAYEVFTENVEESKQPLITSSDYLYKSPYNL
ncbi:uncharacterized protein LOC114251887 [Bombyx mandarina]|uniref:Uncharacterized protein LOC114251887 n=1 Tax=Bombyx mandarina TaxID=7092 RepID=A0A6J2KIE6_BOMMA|nr:uncharacterized protein LOC114251887 [Bombyx mandarina]